MLNQELQLLVSGKLLSIGVGEKGQQLGASTIDRAPLPAVAAQARTTPRDINSLEWFASADDICRAPQADGSVFASHEGRIHDLG